MHQVSCKVTRGVLRCASTWHDGWQVLNPNRSLEGPCSSSSGYCYYATGVGGACAGLGFEPPAGYWCACAWAPDTKGTPALQSSGSREQCAHGRQAGRRAGGKAAHLVAHPVDACFHSPQATRAHAVSGWGVATETASRAAGEVGAKGGGRRATAWAGSSPGSLPRGTLCRCAQNPPRGTTYSTKFPSGYRAGYAKVCGVPVLFGVCALPARARAAWFAAACVRVVCACVRSGEVQRPLCPSGRRPANSGFYAWPWIPMIRVFTPCRESFSYPIAVHVRTCAHSGRPNN